MSRRVDLPAQKVFRLAKDGMTQQKIADHFGVSLPCVQRVLRRHPKWDALRHHRLVQRMRGPRRWTETERMKIVQTYLKLRAVSRTVRALHTNKRTVRATLKQFGIRILSQSETQSGKNNPSWKGGVICSESGRVFLYRPDHPEAKRKKGCYVLRSHLVMERKLGRFLLPGEVVHHKNNDPSDDRPGNLEVFPNNAEHLRQTLKGKCPKWSEEGKARIAEAARRPRARKRNKRRPKCGAPA